MSKPKFVVQQFAICPTNPAAAIELLTALGAEDWARDHVVAQGEVFGKTECRNEADLAFSYTLAPDKEFEVLHYTTGHNWMGELLRWNSASHLGMHCSEEELAEFRAFFKERGIPVAQEVFTESHTNPVISGKRWYHYVIFDTRHLLGIDLKFIVRMAAPHEQDHAGG
jgi:hypothetical protein